MRERNLGARRGAQRCRNPRNHFERDLVGVQRADLLGGVSEYHGVTAFESRDRLALLGRGHHSLVDCILRPDRRTTVAPQADDLGVRCRVLEDLVVNQIVMQNEIRPLQAPSGS